MRGHRAVAMLWFAAIFLVTSGLIGGFAVDYGQVLFARSEIQSITDDAAVAAAREYYDEELMPEGTLLLDEGRAAAQAKEVIQTALDNRSIRRTEFSVATDVTVAFQNNDNGTWWDGATASTAKAPRVVVTVRYKVSDLMLLDLFSAIGGDGAKTVIEGTYVGSAVICVPGLNPDTLDGACARSDS